MLGPLGRFGRVRGIDTSPELVDFCHERGFSEVELASGERIPAADGSFDLVTLFDTIEHIRDDVGVLREVHRVLRPGGLIFISVPAYAFLYANNDRIAHHERRYTARELRDKLVVSGFAVTQITYFNTLLFPAILPAVLLKKLLEKVIDPRDTTNLSHPIRPRVNRILAAIMSSERHVLARTSLPVGHSIIALGRSPTPKDGRPPAETRGR
jgi:SAM-dependent methyltransferase